MPNQTLVDSGDNSVIRFLLGGEVKKLGNVDPSMTILRYQREIGNRTGSKEVCGKGGFSACRVGLADSDDDGQLR